MGCNGTLQAAPLISGQGQGKGVASREEEEEMTSLEFWGQGDLSCLHSCSESD